MATEKRLVWSDDVEANMCKRCNEEWPNAPCEPSYCFMREALERCKTVDAVEVVRCKDCVYYDPEFEFCAFWHGTRHPEHYCGEGKVDDNAFDQP